MDAQHEQHDTGHSDRRKRLARATLANIGLFVFSTCFSVITKNQAFLSEALHDAGDSMVHGTRYGVETKGLDQDARYIRRLRRAGFFISGTLAGVVAIRTGASFLEGVQETYSASQEIAELSGALVIAGGNVYANRQLEGIEHHSHVSEDSHNHSKVDMVASLGLAACIAADALGVNGAAEAGGSVFAGYTAFEMFRHGLNIDS